MNSTTEGTLTTPDVDYSITVMDNTCYGNMQDGTTGFGIGAAVPAKQVTLMGNKVHSDGTGSDAVRGIQAYGTDWTVQRNQVWNEGQGGTLGRGCAITSGGTTTATQSKNISIADHVFDDTQTSPTMQYQIEFAGPVDSIYEAITCEGNILGPVTSRGSPVSAPLGSFAVTNVALRDNPGYNPVGSVSVTAPSSYTNNEGVVLQVALSGATISALTVAGASCPVSAPFILEPGQSFTITYSGTLTMAALRQ